MARNHKQIKPNKMTNKIKLDIDLISEQLYTLLIDELIGQNNLTKKDIIEELTITATITNKS
jgi:hypothetical protein